MEHGGFDVLPPVLITVLILHVVILVIRILVVLITFFLFALRALWTKTALLVLVRSGLSLRPRLSEHFSPRGRE